MILIVVALIASIIGAISGLGGGVIIKPVLDAVTNMDAALIGFLSTCAVFSMSLSAGIKYLRENTLFEKHSTVLLGVGAVLGGLTGTELFQLAAKLVDNDQLVKAIQNSILFLILLLIIFYVNQSNKRQFHIQNSIAILTFGVILGILSSFLGIGGGPINIAVLTLFFSMDLKKATVNSIILILFSQSSKIIMLFLSDAIPEELEIWMPLYIIPASIAGGVIGTTINKKISKKRLKTIYNFVMLFVIIICFGNICYYFKENLL